MITSTANSRIRELVKIKKSAIEKLFIIDIFIFK